MQNVFLSKNDQGIHDTVKHGRCCTGQKKKNTAQRFTKNDPSVIAKNLVGSAPTCSAVALRVSQVRVLSRSVIALLYVCVCVCVCVTKTGLRESESQRVLYQRALGCTAAECVCVCVSLTLCQLVQRKTNTSRLLRVLIIHSHSHGYLTLLQA